MDEELKKHLQVFGLTKYEAEIYLLLLKYNTLTAAKIAKLSKVPITRIYDVAQSIIDKGLLGIVNTKPKEYAILPFEQAHKNLIYEKRKEFEEEIKFLEKECNAVIKKTSLISGQESPNINNFIFMINGKKAVTKAWHSIFLNAKKEIFIFSGGSEWINFELPRLERLLKRNVDVRVLANYKRATPDIKNAIHKGIKIRASDSSLRGVVADKKYVYLSKKFTSSTKNEDYSCCLTEHKPIVESIREYFLMKWNMGRDL